MITYEEFQKVFEAMVEYASKPKNATDIAAPSPQEQARGVSPLDTLPAQWQNWYWNEATKRFNGDAELVGNMVAEVENLLKVCEIEADADSVTQLKEMFAKAYPDKILAEVREDIATIQSKIPNQASAENQLADKDFVNSSIATNTANYIGNFDSVEDLEAYSGTLTNNDYAYVVTTDEAGNVVYNRYKYNQDDGQWMFEYKLNNTGFTAQQMAAINSGATSGKVSKLDSDGVYTGNVNASQVKTLATVATSGSYNDLSNKPTLQNIPLPLSIENGGTGKTNAYDAMANLFQNIDEMSDPNEDEMIMAQRKNNGTCNKYTLKKIVTWLKTQITSGTTNYIKYGGTTYSTMNVTTSNGVVTFNFS